MQYTCKPLNKLATQVATDSGQTVLTMTELIEMFGTASSFELLIYHEMDYERKFALGKQRADALLRLDQLFDGCVLHHSSM